MKTNKKPESDSQLLENCKCREALAIEKGKPFDLEHELSTAIARRDYDAANRKAARQLCWNKWVYRAISLGIAAYVYINWDDLSLKLLLLLLVIFLWRSINRHVGIIQLLQIKTMELLAMAHPDAEREFFNSEHCYSQPRGWEPAWNLLHDKALVKQVDERVAQWLAEKKAKTK